ncbi:MAG: hypothetical protein J2P20_08765 [Pseudonocardia sp.]|nr:hypothetical protein [Pseudonocardia sp.]MBO0876147.1 hypothetical protein [Pseudonocardia sp.]
MAGYLVNSETLAAHAASLDDHAGRLDAVSQAADHPLAPNAYGLVCGFLSGMTGDAEAGLRLSIDTLASVTGMHAAGVNGCAADYRRLEDDVAAAFGCPR